MNHNKSNRDGGGEKKPDGQFAMAPQAKATQAGGGVGFANGR
jgi:hypothetical protein